MRKKRINYIFIVLVIIFIFSSCSITSKEKKEYLVLKDQGMFSSGGITLTSDGVFNAEDQWEETGKGKPPMWTMLMYFIRFL